jgi:hypothetical protein
LTITAKDASNNNTTKFVLVTFALPVSTPGDPPSIP